MFELGVELEPPQRITPHPFENLPYGPELIGTRAIKALAAVGAHIDESGFGQRAQVQRDGAECDIRHGGGNGAGLQLLVPHQTEDFAAARRSDGGKRGGHSNNLVKTKI